MPRRSLKTVMPASATSGPARFAQPRMTWGNGILEKFGHRVRPQSPSVREAISKERRKRTCDSASFAKAMLSDVVRLLLVVRRDFRGNYSVFLKDD